MKFVQLVLIIGLVQARQTEESPNIMNLLFYCAQNPESSEICQKLNDAFPKMDPEFPEEFEYDPLGIEGPPKDNLNLQEFTKDFETRSQLSMEGMDEEVINCMYEVYQSMTKLTPITEKCLHILIDTQVEIHNDNE